MDRKVYIYNPLNLYVARASGVEQVQLVHFPTLKTVMAIEEAVKNSDSAVSRNQILERLPTKVMRSTLNFALGYMEERGLVLETKNGFVWTYNPSRRLAKAEKEALEV